MSAINAEQFDQIIDAISVSSDGLRKICADVGCYKDDLFRYIKKTPGAMHQYAHAKNMQAYASAEEITEIASEPPPTDDSGKMDSAFVAWQRVRIDAIKWQASKSNPKSFGDNVTQTNLNIDVSAKSEEIIEKLGGADAARDVLARLAQ